MATKLTRKMPVADADRRHVDGDPVGAAARAPAARPAHRARCRRGKQHHDREQQEHARGSAPAEAGPARPGRRSPRRRRPPRRTRTCCPRARGASRARADVSEVSCTARPSTVSGDRDPAEPFRLRRPRRAAASAARRRLHGRCPRPGPAPAAHQDLPRVTSRRPCRAGRTRTRRSTRRRASAVHDDRPRGQLVGQRRESGVDGHGSVLPDGRAVAESLDDAGELRRRSCRRRCGPARPRPHYGRRGPAARHPRRRAVHSPDQARRRDPRSRRRRTARERRSPSTTAPAAHSTSV